MNRDSTGIFLFSATMLMMSNTALSAVIDCPNLARRGLYNGHFTDVISRDGWPHVTFIFRTEANDDICVQSDESNVWRYNLIMNAFILHTEVAIAIDDLHKITAIGYKN